MKNLPSKIYITGSIALLFGLVSQAYAGVGISVGLVVRTPPPAPRHEVVVVQPSPRHVWVSGYWRWETNRHVWIGGHWELPPREHVVYAPAHWVQRPDGYVMVDGEWQDSSPTVSPVSSPADSSAVIVMKAPPTPPGEQPGVPPSSSAVWAPGHWLWINGSYVWNPGQWIEPPTRDSEYVAAHWETRGAGFVFCPGYWRQNSTIVQPSSPAPVYVTSEPPPPVVHEVIVARPSHDHIWIGGHWYWSNGRYAWEGGRWERPPHRHSCYVSPRWERRGGSYIMIGGYWR